MERNPEKCKNSACIGGVYICRLACLPCEIMKKCAMNLANDMAGMMTNTDLNNQTKEDKTHATQSTE